MIQDTLKKLQQLAAHEQQKFTLFYIDNSESICNWIQTFDGVKTQMNLHSVKKQIDLLRFSLVFSDLIILYPLGEGEKKITVPKTDKPQSLMKSLTIPREILSKFDLLKTPFEFIPGYISCGFEQLKHFSIELRQPLAKNRMVLRPDRIVLTPTDQKSPDGGRIWQALGVEKDSPVTQWIVSEKTAQTNAIPLIENLPDSDLQKELQTIMVPYLSGISINDLEKVIQDNSDCISNFRVHIKELIKNYGSIKDLNEINSDLIKPEVEKINRKFNQVANIHSMRVKGVVAVTAVVSMAALTTLGVNTAIYGLLGAGGLGLINSESKFKEDLAELENNPMFLLWKIKQLKK